MTKQEKEQRKLGLELERQAEIDAILERSLKTRPPSDVDLRTRLSQEPLGFPTVVSGGEGQEQGDSSCCRKTRPKPLMHPLLSPNRNRTYQHPHFGLRQSPYELSENPLRDLMRQKLLCEICQSQSSAPAVHRNP